MTKLRALLLPFVIVFAFSVPAGCGGGGGGGGSTPGPGADFFRATNVIVKPNVLVLPATVVISNRTATGVTLTNAPAGIAVGTVIVSGEGAGMMRKVTGVTPSGNDLVLQTQDAPLTDVFTSANIEFSRELKPSEIAESNILLPGSTVGSISRSRQTATTLPISIPKTFVGTQVGTEKYGVEIQANGNLTVALTGSIQITPANGLEQLAVGYAVKWNGTHRFALVGEAEEFSKVVPIAEEIFSPIPLGAVGPVPIVVLPVLTVQLTAQGSVKGGWENSGSGTARFSGGLAYVQSPLGSPISTDQFAATTSASISQNLSTSNFFAELKFEATPLQLELATSFDGLIGPTFKIDPPAAVVSLKLLTSNNVQVNADAAFRLKAGAKAGMFALSLPLFEVTAVERKYPIYEHVFGPGDGEVEVR